MATNTKALKTSTSAQLVGNQKQRPPKESFCEFDIVENYQKSKQNRRKKGAPKGTSELTKKINAFAARNAEIEKMYNNKHASDSSSVINNLQPTQISSGDGNSNERNKTDEYKTRQRRTVSCEPQHTKKSRNVREERRERRIRISNNTSDEKETSIEYQTCNGISCKSKTICPYCSGQVRKHSKQRYKRSNDTTNIETNGGEASELIPNEIITVYENVNAIDLSESVISKDFKDSEQNARNRITKSRQDYSKYIQNSIKIYNNEERRKQTECIEEGLLNKNKEFKNCPDSKIRKSERKASDKSTRRNLECDKEEKEHTRSDKTKREDFKDYQQSITKSSKSEKVKKDFENNRKHNLFGKRRKKKSIENMITSDILSTPRSKITFADKGEGCKNTDRIQMDNKPLSFYNIATAEKVQDQTVVLNNIVKNELFEGKKDVTCNNAEINQTDNTSNTTIYVKKKKVKGSRSASPKKIVTNISSNHSFAISKNNADHQITQEGGKTKNLIELTADESLKKLLEIYKREHEKLPKGIYNRKEFRTTINIVRSPEEEINQLKRNGNKSKIDRKELSFSNLNLTPVLYSNFEDNKPATTQTSKLNTSDLSMRDIINKSFDLNQSFGKLSSNSSELDMNKTISQTTLALRDIYKVAELEKVNTNKKRHGRRRSDKRSVFSDIVTKQEIKNNRIKNIAQNNKFHTSKTVMPNERIVEISSKILKDEKISFTVEGVEPAKRIDDDDGNMHRISKLTNLKKQTFPGIDVNLSDVRLLNHGAKVYSKDSLDVPNTKTYSPLESVSVPIKNVSNSPRGKRPFNLFCIKKDHSKKKTVGLRMSEKRLEIFHNKSFFVQHNTQCCTIADSTTQTVAKEREEMCSSKIIDGELVRENHNKNMFEDKSKKLKDATTETRFDLEKSSISVKDTQDATITTQCINTNKFVSKSLGGSCNNATNFKDCKITNALEDRHVASKPPKEVIQRRLYLNSDIKTKRAIDSQHLSEKISNDVKYKMISNQTQRADLKYKEMLKSRNHCSNTNSKTALDNDPSHLTEVFKTKYSRDKSYHSDTANSKNLSESQYSSGKALKSNGSNYKTKLDRKHRSKSLCSDIQRSIYQQTSRETFLTDVSNSKTLNPNQSFCSDASSSKKTFFPQNSKIPIQMHKGQRSKSLSSDARLLKVNYMVKTEKGGFVEMPRTNSKSEDSLLTKHNVSSKFNKSKSLMSINKSSYQSIFEVNNCVLETTLNFNQGFDRKYGDVGQKNVIKQNNINIQNSKREAISGRRIFEHNKKRILNHNDGKEKHNTFDIDNHTLDSEHMQNVEGRSHNKTSFLKSPKCGFSKSNRKHIGEQDSNNISTQNNRISSLSPKRHEIKKINNQNVTRGGSDYSLNSKYRFSNYNNAEKTQEIKKSSQKQGSDVRNMKLIKGQLTENQQSEEIINCHRKEIQALEKCLNDILRKLSKDDKIECENNKVQNKYANCFELSPKNSKEVFISKKDSGKKIPENLYLFDRKESFGHNFQPICYFNENPRNDLGGIKKSSVHDNILLNGRKKTENTKRKLYRFRRNMSESTSNKTHLSTIKSSRANLCKFFDKKITTNLRNNSLVIESFYKNSKGFISSSTNLSSKISQDSSSSYPKSTPSLDLGLSTLQTVKYYKSFDLMKDFGEQLRTNKNEQMMTDKYKENDSIRNESIIAGNSNKNIMMGKRLIDNMLMMKGQHEDNSTYKDKPKCISKGKSKLRLKEINSTDKKVITKRRRKQPLDDIRTILKVRNLSISHITESLSNIAILSVSSCAVHKPLSKCYQQKENFNSGNWPKKTVNNQGEGMNDNNMLSQRDKIEKVESVMMDSDSNDNSSNEIDYPNCKLQNFHLELPRDSGMISKEPFYIHKQDKGSNAASTDSLETIKYDVDLCPLTAIFNFSPPSYAYHVYNAITIPLKNQEGQCITNEAVDETRNVQTAIMEDNINNLIDGELRSDDGALNHSYNANETAMQTVLNDNDADTSNSAFNLDNKIYEPTGLPNKILEEIVHETFREAECGHVAINVRKELPSSHTIWDNNTVSTTQQQYTSVVQSKNDIKESSILRPWERVSSNNQSAMLRNGTDNSTDCSESKMICGGNLNDNTVYETKSVELKNNAAKENTILQSKEETPKILTTWAINASRRNNPVTYRKYRDESIFNTLKPNYTKSPTLSTKFIRSEKTEKKSKLCKLADASKVKCNTIKFNYMTKTNTPIISKQQLGPIKQIEMNQFLSDTPSDFNLSTSSSTIRDVIVSNESGYESSKPNCTKPIKNFFKKGGSLLELFKNAKHKKSQVKKDKSSASSIPLEIIEETTSGTSYSSMETNASKTVLWFNFGRKKNQTTSTVSSICKKTCQKNQTTPDELVCKGTSTCRLFKKCTCMVDVDKQKLECKKYAEKVMMEAALRKEGYRKQYNDFKEIPLDVLMGKKMQKPTKRRCVECTPIGIQTKELTPVHSVAKILPEKKSEKKIEVNEEDEEERAVINFGDEDEILSFTKSAIIESPEDEKLLALSTGSQGSVQERKLTDKEVFDRLLDNFERKSNIAERLSKDDEFFKTVNSQENRSKELEEKKSTTSAKITGSIVKLVEQRYKGPRFTEKTTPTDPKIDCTVNAEDIGTCFARGFRPDNMMLSGDACFNLNKQDKIKMSPEALKNTESIIDFSERETPLDFLLALGFMVDEASNALKDDDIRSRLLAAITEARVWINKITTTQGTLLYLVAYKARPETMRYFLQLVEAIINKRISNAIKLDGFLRVLEQVEDGRLQMITILGEDKFEDEENEEKIVKKQLKHLFINVYTIAEQEAAQLKKEVTSQQVALLRILVAKYRAGLHPHLELIARYIGQGLLDSEVQLEAAMIFLSRLDTADVKLKEFENYCGIRCEKK